MAERLSKTDAFVRLDNTKFYTLTDDVTWELLYKGSPFVVTIPKGFTFDFSSPAFLDWLINPHNRVLLGAAALHDYLLKIGADRSAAAAAFRRALTARGTAHWKAVPMSISVWLWTTLT